MDDEALYAVAFQELQSEQLDEAVWAESLAKAAGNEPLARAAYVELRKQKLQAERGDAPIEVRDERLARRDRTPEYESRIRLTRKIEIGLIMGALLFGALAVLAFSSQLAAMGVFFACVLGGLLGLVWRTRRAKDAARRDLAALNTDERA